MNNNSLKIHPEYGANPTMGVCYFCEKETGEIALLGYNKNKKAPMRSILSYVPCDTCKEAFKAGTLLIEVQTRPVHEGMPEIQKGLYPTARFMLIKNEAAERIFNNPEKSPVCLLDKEAFDKINEMANPKPEETKIEEVA